MASIAQWKRRINTNLLNNLAVAESLAPERIEEQCRALGHRWRQRIWTPGVAMLTFLMQVLDPKKSLRAGVAQMITHMAAGGCRDLPSQDASSHCQARQRLPSELFPYVLFMLAQDLGRLVGHAHRWLGRRVWTIDATTASMPDTPELQQHFPQPGGQQAGRGFPVPTILSATCWSPFPTSPL